MIHQCMHNRSRMSGQSAWRPASCRGRAAATGAPRLEHQPRSRACLAQAGNATVSAVKEGDVLNGRYRLLFPIGEGGMGAVWRARQIQLDADVAIKVLHAKTAEGAGAISRFKREAKAAAALRSPHVVQVVDCDVDEVTGTAFIAMELLEGESLAARLVRTGKLGPEETARWISHVARALTRAHAAGVVHRDLKPANIFIVRNEDEELAKVLDFGIAKLVGQHSDTATATGSLLGTPHYMSPEQIDPSRTVDFRADLWSLAVIACECLTGRRPFEGDTLASLAMKIALGRYDLPSSLGPVPRDFDAWFVKGTEVDPKRRFDSALELAATLREVVESGGVKISEPSNAPPPATTRQDLTASVPGLSARAAGVTDRSGKWRGVALAAGLVLLGGAGALWAASRGSSQPTGVLTTANAGRSVAVSSGSSGGPVASALDAGVGGRSPLREARPAVQETLPSSEPRAPGVASVGTLAPRTQLDSASASRATPAAAAAHRSGSERRRGSARKRTTASTASSTAPKAAATPASKKTVDAYDLP
jgi:eukaryotic-like serine/threonine-protein kinase